MARAGLLSCIFAQRCDVTAGETGNSWDYLTSTFHSADLRLELIQGAIREKNNPLKLKGDFLLKGVLKGCSKMDYKLKQCEIALWTLYTKNKHESYSNRQDGCFHF